MAEVVTIQMEHSGSLLDQKIREIEIEAVGILNSDKLKTIQLCVTEDRDVYDYIMAANDLKEYLTGRQRSNVGMAEFKLYWPYSHRVVSNAMVGSIDPKAVELFADNEWIYFGNDLFFIRKYETDDAPYDEEPYLMIKMDRDYLYDLKSMASGIGSGGTLLIYDDKESYFSTSEEERELIAKRSELPDHDLFYEMKLSDGKYQIVESEVMENGLQLVSYYPLNAMKKSIVNITWMSGISMLVVLLVGIFIIFSYYKHILMQMKLLTEKLHEVESGDLTTQITNIPDSELSYVFVQFNHMVARIKQLIDATVREQELRSQAELEQLQLQINPHFLYNSLSYIVAVAKDPQAVTKMAVHLANYYRYCTQKKTITTVREEIFYARAYLFIMAMRKNIDYEIVVEDGLEDMEIIPLILQPIIENAAEHGIEERENAKRIYIKIHTIAGGTVRFEISDDGQGMTEEQIEQLMKRIRKSRREENESVGLWNVNQRLLNYYSTTEGLQFSESIWGGLMVSFTIQSEKKETMNDRTDC